LILSYKHQCNQNATTSKKNRSKITIKNQRLKKELFSLIFKLLVKVELREYWLLSGDYE